MKQYVFTRQSLAFARLRARSRPFEELEEKRLCVETESFKYAF